MRIDLLAHRIRHVLVSVVVLAIVVGCGNNASTATQLATMSCSAYGSGSSGSTTVSVTNATVSIAGGTAPYQITFPGVASVSSSSSSYTYNGTLSVSVDTSGNSTSYVTVTAANGASTSCVLSVSGGGNTGGSNNGANYPPTYYPPYYPTTSVSCSLQFNVGYFYVGQQILFWISSNSSEAIYVTNLNTGEPYATQPSYPLSQYFYVRYSQPGPKQLYVYAQTASGIPCNGGAVMTDSIFVNYYW